jgi:hypothetical protein
VVDVDAELIAAGLKASPTSGEVMAVSNGTSVLIYVHPDYTDLISSIRKFLDGCDWTGQVFGPDELAEVGQAPQSGLAFAVSMRASEAPNAFGILGASLAARPAQGKPDRLGCGQHGGLGRYEQQPFMMISGPGFAAGTVRDASARVVDIAPTVLVHLGVPCADVDGRPLQNPPNE